MTALRTLLATAALALLLAHADPASAGTYRYVTCTSPDARPNEVFSGWTASAQGPGASAYFECDQARLRIGFTSRGPYGEADGATMAFDAPADLTIAGHGYDIQTEGVSFCAPGGSCDSSQNSIAYYVHLDGRLIHACAPFSPEPDGRSSCPQGEHGRWDASGSDSQHLALSLMCGHEGSGGCSDAGTAANALLSNVYVSLNDGSDPIVTRVEGPLLRDGDHGGKQEVSVTATDEGSGIALARILVDGVEQVSVPVDLNVVNGVARCQSVGSYTYRWPVPCKKSAGQTLALDTTRLSTGRHDVQVLVDDASGNAAVAYRDRDFEVRNGAVVSSTDPPVAVPPGPLVKGVPNGVNASADVVLSAAFANGRAAVTTRYGKRAVVRGTLKTRSGLPVGGARVELGSRVAVAGAGLVDKGGARTRADGAWTLILPAGSSSRSLRFGYRPVVGEGALVAQKVLRLSVRARSSLVVSPGVARNGSTLSFRGVLAGRPVPRGGKVVDLQARGRGGREWITFLTPRSDALGRFGARYRLKNTSAPVVYEFRVVVRREAGYPYLTGSSPVRAVKVR